MILPLFLTNFKLYFCSECNTERICEFIIPNSDEMGHKCPLPKHPTRRKFKLYLAFTNGGRPLSDSLLAQTVRVFVLSFERDLGEVFEGKCPRNDDWSVGMIGAPSYCFGREPKRGSFWLAKCFQVTCCHVTCCNATCCHATCG